MQIEIPTLRAPGWPGAFVEAAELAGAPIWGVPLRHDLSGAVRRRYFTSEPEALVWSAGQADLHGIGLFDLTDRIEHG